MGQELQQQNGQQSLHLYSLIVIISAENGTIFGKTSELVVQTNATFAAFQALHMPFLVDGEQVKVIKNLHPTSRADT